MKKIKGLSFTLYSFIFWISTFFLVQKFFELFNASDVLVLGTISFHVLLNLLVHNVSAAGVSNESNVKFNNQISIGIIIRMFCSLIFIVVYMLVSKQIDVAYVCFHLILYLFFIIFEIYFLLVNLRTNFKNTTEKQ